MKSSTPTRNCIHDGFPCDASDLCEECPLKSSETLGEELARKSVETFEAEKAYARVIPSVCGKPMPNGKGAGQCVNVPGHEGECDDMPF